MLRRWTRQTALAALLVALALTPQVRAAGAKDVLKFVPDDAWGFVVATSLDNIDKAAEEIKSMLGLPFPTPITPRGTMMFPFGNEIDRASHLGLVYINLKKLDPADQASYDKGAAAIVPIKDKDAFLTALQATNEEEGIAECNIMGQPAFVFVKGNMAVIGPNRKTLELIIRSDKNMDEALGRARMQVAEKSDLFVSFTFAGLYDNILKDTVMPMLEMTMAVNDPSGKSAEQLKQVFAQLATIDIAFAIGKDGLTLSLLSTARAGSDMAKMLADTKNAEAPLLAHLPKEKFLFAMSGTALYSEHAKSFGGDTPVSNWVEMLQLDDVNKDTIKTMDKAFVAMTKLVDQWAVSISALPAENNGAFGIAKVVKTSDSKACMREFRRLYDAFWQTSDDEDFRSAREMVTHVPEAEEIAGVKVDTITLDLRKLADMFEVSEDEMDDFNKLIGDEFVVRFGPLDGEYIVATVGGGKERFESVCQAAKAGSGLTSDAGIKTVSGLLVAPRATEGYIALDNLGQWIRRLAVALGEPDEFPFEDIPTVDAPIAFASAQLDDVSRTDIVVPAKLLKAGKELFERYGQMSTDEFDEEFDPDMEEDLDADLDDDLDDDLEDEG